MVVTGRKGGGLVRLWGGWRDKLEWEKEEAHEPVGSRQLDQRTSSGGCPVSCNTLTPTGSCE